MWRKLAWTLFTVINTVLFVANAAIGNTNGMIVSGTALLVMVTSRDVWFDE